MIVLKCFVYKQLFGENMKGIVTAKILKVGIVLALLSSLTSTLVVKIVFSGHESEISKPAIFSSISKGKLASILWGATSGACFSWWATATMLKESKKINQK